ncbi:MAG: discoidin domain-containing protein [Oscillospiraceae bacterium]|nr:discoidin domain-containing protein [Oscillospiraceae bacterium]
MKNWKRRLSAVIASCIALTATGITAVPAHAARTVALSPDDTYAINNGVFEGWGTSLCWWANRVGYSDSLAQKCADTFFGENGLRLNIARFNIGGGDNPTHNHITRTDSNMPGYTKYQNGTVTYDWSADANQRNVLQRCIKAAGDDMIVEMFSNSPPYWMCKSGCSTGNNNPGANNLKDDCYDDFAEYLAEVCKHYKEEWGVTIQSVEAMNEPYTNFWGAGSAKQEGCHFDIGNSESTIILELQKSMAKRGMEDVIISASDETSIDTQIDAYNALSGDAKKAVGRIDTHTYGGSKRSQLKDLALSAGKNLWMSEVDGNGASGQNAGAMAPGLWLSERITADCNGLNASAWILWQVIDKHVCAAGYMGKKDSGMVDMTKGFWGTAVADHDQDTIVLSKKYYCFGQYTRYIRPGMIMLNCSGNTMAAYDKENGQVVIVSYNTSAGNSDMVYDLSAFSQVGTEAKTIRTSNSEEWKDVGASKLNGSQLAVSLAPNSVTTFIIDGVKGSIERENKIDLKGKQVTGTNSWHDDESTGPEKAFDGNKATFFDGVGDGYTQVDLGETYDLEEFGYCPRSGYEYRAIDGMIQVSDDGQNWETVYTVTGEPSYGMHYYKPETPVSARYVRYAVPSGAPKNSANKDSVYCCNIAEIELYGKPHTAETTTTTETEPPKPQKLKGDVDANGKVAVADAVMLVKYLVTSEDKVTDPEAADMNEDGILNGTDLSLLKCELLK